MLSGSFFDKKMESNMENNSTEWVDKLAHIFARDEFATGLLERSFRQFEGWIELGIVLALTVLAFLVSQKLIDSDRVNSIKFRTLQHLVKRVLFPLLMLVLGVVAQIIWTLLDFQAVWLRLLVLAAYWMIVIRVALALFNRVLPESSWKDSTERSLSAGLWVWFLLWVSGIDDWIINWFKSIEFTVGKSTLNLYTILTGLLWVGVVMMLMMWLAKWINTQLMSSTRLDINLRIVLSKITKTVLMILSVLIALPLVGIDLTVLSVFGGALGVGLGFGLQKIASNYVSGFIILADRSIRPGDRLTVNGFTGYVTEINARFVVLRSAAGADALIPNENFVTNMVINESYTGKSLSQSLDIQVAYQTDLTLALRILKEAAAEQERVAQTPEPSALLIGFGDNGIDLRVTFWVKDPENGFGRLFSDILLTIWRRFNEENIDFPFPQREIRILSDEQTPNDLALQKAKMHSTQEIYPRDKEH